MNEAADIATESEAQRQARAHARLYLKAKTNPDSSFIRRACEKAVRDVVDLGATGSTDVEELCRYFERVSNIFVPESKSLDDSGDSHIPWLSSKRASIKWNFWERYEAFLETVEELPQPVVQSLDVETDKILERIEDPARPGAWDRRGLVVGSVQSGKTGNFLGLSCKAIDAGYKLIIVLAGTHNSLRTQTQIRAEESLLGFQTSREAFIFDDANARVGVGTLKFPDLPANSMTTREEDGDFKAAMLGPTLSLGGDPFILIVKKHVRILKNLENWILRRHGIDTPSGGKIVPNIPMLLIDDEADHASINTRAIPPGDDVSNYDVTKTNERIRSLLQIFEKKIYVGYTATPFANIFINPDAAHEKLGDDIFPRSFILNLPVPPNYVGAEIVLGRDGDDDAGIEEMPGLGLVREVVDQAESFPAKYGKDFRPPGLPASLKEAIRAFILTCAARRARGKPNSHNSMLVHVVRFVDVQRHVADLVRAELLFLQRRIAQEGPRDARRVRDELRDLWERDFIPTTARVSAYLRSKGLEEVTDLEWADVERELLVASAKIEVREINGTSADILDYETERNKKEGLSVIAIGGDKLSRGLTLSGLSVSYYLRLSKMYDTLLQMGRWFGYRDGYLDLCRLYTTPELKDWYRHIALADRELRFEFDRMYDSRLTPKEYGLRVRTHPSGLRITALNKSRCSSTMQVSFEGELVQTATLYKEPNRIERNWNETGKLLTALGPPPQPNDAGNFIWTHVSRVNVSTFIRNFEAPMGMKHIGGDRVATFIEKQARTNELSEWTVALISNSRAPSADRATIAGLGNIGLTVRDPRRVEDDGPKKGQEIEPAFMELRNSNLISPPDQGLDITGVVTEATCAEILNKKVFKDAPESEREIVREHVGKDIRSLALALTNDRVRRGVVRGAVPAKNPNGRVYRDLRPVSRGLLLLYLLDWRDRRQPGVSPRLANIESDLPIVGYALSFPTSNSAEPVEYQVGEIYKRLHLDTIESTDDE